ncbi:MAG: ATP-binding protein [Abyssibacter sp.]|uniref:sensor histidine kinase n=1 Tax=Abyssibacter sp. TaxID=2320200 RepID=UPI00321A6FDC
MDNGDLHHNVQAGGRSLAAYTRGYVVALSLLAVLATAHLVVKRWSVDAAAAGATVINISGRQRMLSQRVALLAARLRQERILGREQADTEQALRDAAREFLQSHLDLTRGNASRGLPKPEAENVLSAYFAGEPSLDAQVRQYVWQANQVADDRVLDEAALPIFADAPTQLLHRLNEVVAFNEANARAAVARIDRLQIWFWALTLVTLLLEGLLIFRPIVRRTRASLAAYEAESARLAEAGHEMQEFAYRTSHDLVSPMTSIQGTVQAVGLLLDSGDTQRARHGLALIDQTAQRAKHLVRDIEALSGVGAQSLGGDCKDVRAVLEVVCAELSDEAAQRSVRLVTDLRAGGPWRVPELLLRQVSHNLIHNAIVYADPDASVAARVEVRLDVRDGQLVLSVQDNGVGIDPVHTGRLFGLFERFRPDLANGSGLGLYLVRKLVQRVGGQVQYEACSPGSRFTVQLPQSETHAE